MVCTSVALFKKISIVYMICMYKIHLMTCIVLFETYSENNFFPCPLLLQQMVILTSDSNMHKEFLSRRRLLKSKSISLHLKSGICNTICKIVHFLSNVLYVTIVTTAADTRTVVMAVISTSFRIQAILIKN